MSANHTCLPTPPRPLQSYPFMWLTPFQLRTSASSIVHSSTCMFTVLAVYKDGFVMVGSIQNV